MTATSLPDRLRALAEHIDFHNLPEPSSLSVSNAEFVAVTAHFDSHDDLCRWAEEAGRKIDVREVDGSSGPFTAYTVDVALPGWQWFTAAYYRHHAPAAVSA